MSLPSTVPRPRRRWLWIFAGGFLLGGTVILGLLLMPPVQGWLLRRFVAAQSGWRLEFERIGVGPTGVDARSLAFTMPGLEASTTPLAIRVAPTRLFSRRELRIEQIDARKIRLTVTPAQFAPAGNTPSAPFDGVLRLLQAPLPWALDTAHLDGEIVVRDAGQPRLTGGFSLRGGGLSAATPGEFTYELSAESTFIPAGSDRTLTSTGRVHLEQTAAHGIARLTVDGDLHLPGYGALKLPAGRLNFDVTGHPSGETYQARLTLGPAAHLAFDAALDAPRSTLTGHATLHADQSLAASLFGERLPRATVDATVSFTLNLRTGDLDAALTGDLEARDWQKILPQLSVLDAFKGRLAAALIRRGEQVTVQSLAATLRGESTPTEASLTLTQPFDPRQPPATPVATLTLQHWPVAWANPWLVARGLQLAPAEFAGAWTLAVGSAPTVQLAPVRPATLGPILLRGEKIPALPAVDFSFSPAIEISAARLALTVADFSATSAQGDRVTAQLEAARETATGALRTRGALQGAVPSLLGDAGAPPPFFLHTRWAAEVTGSKLQVTEFDFTARPGNDAPPDLVLALERPFEFDLEKHAPVANPSDLARDWLRLRLAGFPLAWLSHWLPGRTVTGTIAAGESVVRPAPDDGYAVHTTTPWRLQSLSLTAADSPPYLIDAELAPTFVARSDRLVGAIEGLVVSDAAANRVTGRLTLDAAFATKNFSTVVALDATLPALPHSAETFGALQGSLRAKFHNMSMRLVGADEFALHVRNATGELLALEAPLPFIFGLSNADMVVVSTLTPLRLKLGGFPLAWLRPWSGALALGGTVAPMELQLASTIDRYAVRPVTPVKLENFSAQQGDRELLRAAAVVFHPGLDLTFICVTKPKFQLAYTGTAHVTDAQIDLAGRRALDLDFALGFKGNESLTLLDALELTSRVDFSALPNAAAFGLPPRGTLVTRINGELLGHKPVELWTRLTGVPAREAQAALPPLELTLRGKLSRENVFAGSVELLLAATPQPSDATFDVSLNLLEGGLKITSGFHSQFLDGAALLALARAFPPAKTNPPKIPPRQSGPATAREHSAAYASLPFWGELSGSFDLDLGAVQFAPYRIDHVRGRLDATDTTLALRDLSGEMFAGRWGGGLQIAHGRGVTTGEHQLSGEFRIEQFESARVVQTVFPNQLASVDGRIDVRAQIASTGTSFVGLLDNSVADFSIDGTKGVVRLTVPKADLVSTAAVFGGTVLLSPELRALGRLLKKFAEMPIEQLSITGRRAVGGEVRVDEFRFESPQARLRGRGRIATVPSQPWMNSPLELSLELAAKDELAVILGGMSLLEKKPRADGFRPMRQTFTLGGRAGAPDTAPLYDLLAQAVGGSSGTWGFLMRKVQAEVEKKKTPATKATP